MPPLCHGLAVRATIPFEEDCVRHVFQALRIVVNDDFGALTAITGLSVTRWP
jgi:16S rRNA C1402 N4-methylase RsmH